MSLLATLVQKWLPEAVEYKALTTGRPERASLDLDVGALSETGRSTNELLRSLTGQRSEDLNCLGLLNIYGKGNVAVLHLLFCMTASEYEDGMGVILEVKGGLPSKIYKPW